MIVTPPPGNLSADPPVYPGEHVDWTIQYYKKKTRIIQLNLPISADNRTIKKQNSIPIGKSSKDETDEQNFKRGWHILNYIYSLDDWDDLTKDEISVRLMAAANERYHLKGRNASKYGPFGYIASRVEGEKLHIATLNQEATIELDAQRRNRGLSAETHVRAIVDVPLQQQHLLEDDDVQVNENTITRIISFFMDMFGDDITAMENEAINVNGTADSFENLASSRMLSNLGGPTAGVGIQDEFMIDPLPDDCDPDNDIFFWKMITGKPVDHIDTVKFQNVKSLMFYNAMSCFKGVDCVPWDQDHVEEVILDILGDTDSKIWYITKDGYVGYDANEMGSYNIIEIPRDNIHAECYGREGRLIRSFVLGL